MNFSEEAYFCLMTGDLGGCVIHQLLQHKLITHRGDEAVMDGQNAQTHVDALQ